MISVLAPQVFTPLVLVLLVAVSLLLIWQFVGFPLVMGVIALRSPPSDKDYRFQPFISIVIPTHDESASIKQRIENLDGLNYPRENYEIIVVDSGSQDATRDVVQHVIDKRQNKDSPSLRLVTEALRNGKASAINVAKRHARGDIILVTDANSVFDREVLKEVAPHFKNPQIGAVGGRYAVLNPTNTLTSATQFYWDIEQILRTGEARLESACLFHGELNAWRKDIIHLDPEMISEDLDMCINLHKKGYKIEYEPRAVVYERAPTVIEEQIRQRKRTSIGTIKSIIKNARYLAVPGDRYRSIIFPSHKSLVMFSPFLLLSLPVLYLLSYDLHVVSCHAAITVFAFALIFGLLMRVRLAVIVERQTRRERITFRSAYKVLFYVLLNEWIILLAWKDYVFGNYSVLWDKAETTRLKLPKT